MDTTIPDTDTRWRGALTPDVLGALGGRYELLEEVGRGGMGVVFRARHRTLDRLVALKITLPGASTERFLREARLLAQIHSPHVVTVHDCEVLPNGAPLLVMEWVEGTNLLSHIEARRGPLDESEVLPWMRQTSAGMAAAAALGIIHRDFKPSNVLVDNLGRARVADFGLARGPEAQAELTLHGGMMGTPYYMAPEQAENPRGVDSRADIYSYGATFYHALTGATPFEGETVFSVLFRHKTEPLIPPRARNPRLSEHLNGLLERCLAKSPNDRFESFHEVSRQLDLPGQSAWEDWPDDGLAGYLARYQLRREVYLHRREELAEPDVYEFPGGRALKVLVGDMAEQRADALVSSEDGHLTMGETIPNARGVAAALRRAAGPGYVAEARGNVPVRPGRVVVTSAGALPARFVFHGITLEGPVEDRVCPSRDLISEILAACFYHADTLFVKTMAFPLLGTGTGGFSPEVCLDTMFRFLARMLLRGLTSVREVRIILFRRS
jgi:O-acetyl-ADP-ribose deacetylase (regulator of RNase III)/tRNA A-37 threonylcarbamoyl transferase component Bud32